MVKKAYQSNDNIMPDVSLPDDKPSEGKQENKKIDQLPDVREEKKGINEEDIFDNTPRPKTKPKKNVKLEIEEDDSDVKQGRRRWWEKNKPIGVG